MRALVVIAVLALVLVANVDAQTFRSSRPAICAAARNGVNRPYRSPTPCPRTYTYGVCTNFVMWALTGNHCACAGKLWMVRDWANKRMTRKSPAQCQPGDVILGKDFKHVGMFVDRNEICHASSSKGTICRSKTQIPYTWPKGYWCVNPLTSCNGGG